MNSEAFGWFWEGTRKLGAWTHRSISSRFLRPLNCDIETHFLLLRQSRPSLFLLSLIPSLPLGFSVFVSIFLLSTSLPPLSLSLFLCHSSSLHHCIQTLSFPSYALYNSHSPSPWICSSYLCFKSLSRVGKTCALELGVLLELEAPAKDQYKKRYLKTSSPTHLQSLLLTYSLWWNFLVSSGTVTTDAVDLDNTLKTVTMFLCPVDNYSTQMDSSERVALFIVIMPSSWLAVIWLGSCF